MAASSGHRLTSRGVITKTPRVLLNILMLFSLLLSSCTPGATAKKSTSQPAAVSTSETSTEQDVSTNPSFDRPEGRQAEPSDTANIEQTPAESNNSIASSSVAKTSTMFIENVGQVDSHARFYANENNVTI